jgi:hypothetical protein
MAAIFYSDLCGQHAHFAHQQVGLEAAPVVKIRSGLAVTGLVAAALATIGVLTAQASNAPMRPYAAGVTGADTSGPTVQRAPSAPPAGSGAGARVVYSLGEHRVWLVDAHERVVRTYRVTAGDVPPSLGTHRVFARSPHARGSDGTAVENVVFFASADEDNVGFSAAVRGTPLPPDPHHLAAAIRERRADAEVMWKRATIGTLVDVVS